MSHRIFIAINLPEKIKNKLAEGQKKWPELPARWTRKENLHITLEFLGQIIDQDLIDFFPKIRKMAAEKKPFTLKLNKICYGPPKKDLPRMVWVIGEKIKEFNLIPHITLARLKTWEFKQLDLEERPKVDQEIDLSFEVNSIEIMESRLKRTGPEYEILESCPLKN